MDKDALVVGTVLAALMDGYESVCVVTFIANREVENSKKSEVAEK